jgi:hypothetical protein
MKNKKTKEDLLYMLRYSELGQESRNSIAEKLLDYKLSCEDLHCIIGNFNSSKIQAKYISLLERLKEFDNGLIMLYMSGVSSQHSSRVSAIALKRVEEHIGDRPFDLLVSVCTYGDALDSCRAWQKLQGMCDSNKLHMPYVRLMIAIPDSHLGKMAWSKIKALPKKNHELTSVILCCPQYANSAWNLLSKSNPSKRSLLELLDENNSIAIKAWNLVKKQNLSKPDLLHILTFGNNAKIAHEAVKLSLGYKFTQRELQQIIEYSKFASVTGFATKLYLEKISA